MSRPGSLERRTVPAVALALGLVAAGLAVVGPAAASHGDCTAENPADVGNRAVADARGTSDVLVEIVDLQPFDPALLVVDAGTCVRFRNPAANNLPHTVHVGASSNGDALHTLSPGLSPDGEHVDVLLDDPGTYYVHCELNAAHEASMHQVIHVQ